MLKWNKIWKIEKKNNIPKRKGPNWTKKVETQPFIHLQFKKNKQSLTKFFEFGSQICRVFAWTIKWAWFSHHIHTYKPVTTFIIPHSVLLRILLVKFPWKRSLFLVFCFSFVQFSLFCSFSSQHGRQQMVETWGTFMFLVYSWIASHKVG